MRPAKGRPERKYGSAQREVGPASLRSARIEARPETHRLAPDPVDAHPIERLELRAGQMGIDGGAIVVAFMQKESLGAGGIGCDVAHSVR
jgi:hypothetical protein